MEDAKAEEKFLPFDRIVMAGEELLHCGLDLAVASLQGGFDSFGRLVGHFDAVLEDHGWEAFCGVAGEPETERRVHLA